MATMLLSACADEFIDCSSCKTSEKDKVVTINKNKSSQSFDIWYGGGVCLNDSNYGFGMDESSYDYKTLNQMTRDFGNGEIIVGALGFTYKTIGLVFYLNRHLPDSYDFNIDDVKGLVVYYSSGLDIIYQSYNVDAGVIELNSNIGTTLGMISTNHIYEFSKRFRNNQEKMTSILLVDFPSIPKPNMLPTDTVGLRAVSCCFHPCADVSGFCMITEKPAGWDSHSCWNLSTSISSSSVE